MAVKKKVKSPWRRTRSRSPSPRYVGENIEWIKLMKNPGEYENYLRSPPYLDKQDFTMIDIVTPGFAQRKANWGTNNPLVQREMYVSGGDSSSTTGEYARGETAYYRTGFMSQPFRSLSMVIRSASRPDRIYGKLNQLVLRTQTAALAKVDDQSFNTIETLGEWRETVKLLTQPLRGLHSWLIAAERRYLNDLKRYGYANMRASQARSAKERARRRRQIVSRGTSGKDAQRIASFGESLSDLVLSTNLGWVPLVKTIDELLNKMHETDFGSGLETGVARSKSELSDEFAVVKTDHSTFMMTGVSETKHTDKITCRAMVAYRPKLSVSQHWGVRLIDVPQGLWDLAPFSWLVDYMFNVSNYLGAIRAQAYSKIMAYSTTTVVESLKVRTCISVSPVTTNNRTWSFSSSPVGVSCTASYKLKERWPDRFEIEHPTFQRSLEEQVPAHIQNIVSLITSRLSAIQKYR